MGLQWTISLWVLTTAVSQSTLKSPIRTAMKEQCLMHCGNANQLHRCPHIRRRNYSLQASIPICREAWVAVHWFLNQKRSSPAFWKRTCFSREPISSAHVDPFPAFLTLICPRNGLGTFWSKQMEAARDKGGKDTHNQRPNTDIHGCHPH